MGMTIGTTQFSGDARAGVDAAAHAGDAGRRGHRVLPVLRGRDAGRVAGRGFHSSTSQLNMSRSWSLKPYQAPTSQLNLTRFLSMEATTTSNKQCSRHIEKCTGVAQQQCFI